MSPNAPDVFISYRRVGTAGYAGRLYDALAERFGEDRVFMDVEMEPGVDFVDTIVRVVGACDVLLVVIGPEWLAPAKGAKQSRLADPADFVRLEVAAGLRRPDVRVIPLLVGGAQMPRPDALPDELEDLCNRNAVVLSDVRWRNEVVQLMDALDATVEPDEAPVRRPRLAGRGTLWAAGAAGVVLLAVVLVALLSGGSDSPPSSTTAATKGGLTVGEPGELPPATTVPISKGQEWVGTFEASEGEHLAFDLVPDPPELEATMAIFDSADAKVTEYRSQEGLILPERCASALGCQPVTLKHSGPHRVVIQGEGGAGSLRLRLHGVISDDTREVKLGERVDFDLDIGQAGVVTFQSPRAGARVVLRLTNIGLTGFVRILDPEGSSVLDKPEELADSVGEMTIRGTLDRSGTYTVNIRGNDRDTGTVSAEVRPG